MVTDAMKVAETTYEQRQADTALRFPVGFPYYFEVDEGRGVVIYYANEDAFKTGAARFDDGRVAMFLLDGENAMVTDEGRKLTFLGFSEGTWGDDACGTVATTDLPILEPPPFSEPLADMLDAAEVLGADLVPKVDFHNTEAAAGGDVTDLGFAQSVAGWKVRGVVVGREKVDGEFGEEEEILDSEGKRIPDPRNPGKFLTRTIQEVWHIRGTTEIEVVDERTRRAVRKREFGSVRIRCYARLDGPLNGVVRRQDEATAVKRRALPNAGRVWLPIEIECLGRAKDSEAKDGSGSRRGAAFFRVVYLTATKK